MLSLLISRALPSACPREAHLPKYNLGAHFLTASTCHRRPYLGDPHCAHSDQSDH